MKVMKVAKQKYDFYGVPLLGKTLSLKIVFGEKMSKQRGVTYLLELSGNLNSFRPEFS